MQVYFLHRHTMSVSFVRISPKRVAGGLCAKLFTPCIVNCISEVHVLTYSLHRIYPELLIIFVQTTLFLCKIPYLHLSLNSLSH